MSENNNQNGLYDMTHLSRTLFSQIDRLNNDDMTTEELALELTRTTAMTNVAGKLVDVGRLVLDAQVKFDALSELKQVPKQLT